MMNSRQQQWDTAFDRKQDSFQTMCPLFLCSVTRLASAGDFITLQDGEGRYCISGTVRGETTVTAQLTDLHREHLRAWIREQRESGTECPMIDDGRLRYTIEHDLKDKLRAFKARLSALDYSAKALDMRMRGATRFVMLLAGHTWRKGDQAPPGWQL